MEALLSPAEVAKLFTPPKAIDALQEWRTKGIGLQSFIDAEGTVYYLRSVVDAYFAARTCQNTAHHHYLKRWMAYAVQRPYEPGHSAIVMRGRKGAGKSLPALEFGRLFDPHCLQISDPERFMGKFNSHFHNCIVLIADECFWAGNKKHEGNLKRLITEHTLTIEYKGVDVSGANNCIHLLMLSNEEWVVPATVDERRFLFLDVSDKRRGDFDYFNRLITQMQTGGREALFHELLNMDLSSFNVRDVPHTSGLRSQMLASASNPESIMLGYLTEGITPGMSIDKGIAADAFDIDVFAADTKMKRHDAKRWLLERNLLVVDGKGNPAQLRRKLWYVPGHPEKYGSKERIPAEQQSHAERTDGKRLYQFRELAAILNDEHWKKLVESPAYTSWRLESDSEGVQGIPEQSEIDFNSRHAAEIGA